jgi:hypothetical protein
MSWQFDEGNARHFHVHTSSVFCFDAMDLPLSPVTTSFYMEDYKEMALSPSAGSIKLMMCS